MMIETLEQGKHGSFAETPSKKRTESPPEMRSPKEEVLATREKTLSKKIGRGVTDSSFVELKDDGKGVFKTELYQNERAAYLIDRFLGINLTPPTTIRNLDGEVGSMQEFIPDAKMLYEIEQDQKSEYDFRNRHREEFMKMWVFDLIIGNQDRHGGNFLFSGDVLYAIDHGHSITKNGEKFISEMKTYTVQSGFFGEEMPTGLVQSVKKFLENLEYQQILEDLLEELIGKEYAIACLKRIRLIGDMIVKIGKIEEPTSGTVVIC